MVRSESTNSPHAFNFPDAGSLSLSLPKNGNLLRTTIVLKIKFSIKKIRARSASAASRERAARAGKASAQRERRNRKRARSASRVVRPSAQREFTVTRRDMTRPRCTMAHALQLYCTVYNTQTVSTSKRTYKNKFLDQTRTYISEKNI